MFYFNSFAQKQICLLRILHIACGTSQSYNEDSGMLQEGKWPPVGRGSLNVSLLRDNSKEAYDDLILPQLNKLLEFTRFVFSPLFAADLVKSQSSTQSISPHLAIILSMQFTEIMSDLVSCTGSDGNGLLHPEFGQEEVINVLRVSLFEE